MQALDTHTHMCSTKKGLSYEAVPNTCGFIHTTTPTPPLVLPGGMTPMCRMSIYRATVCPNHRYVGIFHSFSPNVVLPLAPIVTALLDVYIVLSCNSLVFFKSLTPGCNPHLLASSSFGAKRKRYPSFLPHVLRHTQSRGISLPPISLSNVPSDVDVFYLSPS